MKLLIKGAKGVTLLELVIALSIVCLLAVLAAPELSMSSKAAKVQDCAKRLASDITIARDAGQASGQRALIVISKDNQYSFAGNGVNENFLAFLEPNPPTESYAAGDTIVAQDSCDNLIVMMPTAGTALPNCANFAHAQCLEFSTLGTLLNTGAADTSVQMTYNDGTNTYLAQVIVVSLTGHLQTQWSQNGGVTWLNF